MGIKRATAKTSNDRTTGSGCRFPSARRGSGTWLRRSSRGGDASMRETSCVERTFHLRINAQGACQREPNGRTAKGRKARVHVSFCISYFSFCGFWGDECTGSRDGYGGG